MSASLRARPGETAGPRTASPQLRRARIFLINWTMAVLATVSAYCVHLAMRGRTVTLGYELGKARSEQARLREVKRVLELESASYKTPERVEIVARSLLGMEPPVPERMISVGARVPEDKEEPSPITKASPP